MTPAPHMSTACPTGYPAAPVANVRIVGCGRRFRRDDQAGLRVAELLAADPPRGATVEWTESPGADLPVHPAGTRTLIVVDASPATRMLPAGAIRRMDYREARGRLRTRSGLDTHTVGLESALALADELGSLPDRVWLYVIGGAEFGYGDQMTPKVDLAVRGLAQLIRRHCDSE